MKNKRNKGLLPLALPAVLILSLVLAGCGKKDGVQIAPERESTMRTQASEHEGDDPKPLLTADGFDSKAEAVNEESTSENEGWEAESFSDSEENRREEEDWAGIEADKQRQREEEKKETSDTKPEKNGSESQSGSNQSGTGNQSGNNNQSGNGNGSGSNNNSGNTTELNDNDRTPQNQSGTTNVDVTKQSSETRPDADTKTGTAIRLTTGSAAPNFTASLASGSSFRLSDYDNKIVLLSFWKSTFLACKTELETLQKIKNAQLDNVEILCVNAGEDIQTVDRFINENTFTLRFAYDDTGKITEYYPADALPYTLLLYKGTVRKIFTEAIDQDQQYRDYTQAIEDCRKAESSS